MLERMEGAFIDGEMAATGPSIDVINPSTEEVFGTFRSASLDDVGRAIASARRAWDAGDWPLLPRTERARFLERFLDHLLEQAPSIRDIIAGEAGCPISSPVMPVQVDLAIRHTREFVAYALSVPEFEQNPVPIHQRISASGAFTESLKRFVPVGVVTAISAYNFPLYINLWKIIPALIAGNTVVLRPSPLTPYSALILAEAAQVAGLPPGVLNVVVDAGVEGGVLMSTHDDVDMVTFTGSSKVGELVAAQAAKGIKRVQLELGGKSAQIFLPDRIDAALGAPAGVCLAHAGQGCALGTRIFVPKEAKADLLSRMADTLKDVRIGDAASPATQVGPVISAAQRDRCEHYVDVAVANGARVVVGGKRPANVERGYFFQPTILDLPDNSNPAAQDEIFGPVVGVIGYDSIDHAVEMANDSPFGLSGYVYGRDMNQAISVAERLRTGTVNINTLALSPYTSSGGFGLSGIGRERGLEGLRCYQQIQVLNVGN